MKLILPVKKNRKGKVGIYICNYCSDEKLFKYFYSYFGVSMYKQIVFVIVF